MVSNSTLNNDLFAMYQEQDALEFSRWVNSVEKHVSNLKMKLCKSCNKSKLEVVNMHKAEFTNCRTLNSF